MPRKKRPKATILVVDDDSGVRGSLVTLLGAPGRRVLTAASGAEGLAVLERETVDLILSDMNMPGMDGLAFLAAARRLRPGVRALLMTVHMGPKVRAAVDRGEVVCLLKSGDPDAILIAVAHALPLKDA